MAVVRRDFRKLAKAAASAADDKKAEDVVVLDIRKESDIADYLVIAGANSSTQMSALSEWVEEALQDKGVKVLHRDGKSRSRWMALDFGGLVVHILLAEARDFYRLENLWEKAKPVKWETK
jgi:ribosome-associated protein